MASWRSIAATETDHRSPVVVALMDALAENPVALSEGATDSPYVQSAWHPHNGAEWGDGETGRFYHFPTQGALASIETPNFVDGYEYRVIYNALLSTVAPSTLRVEVFGQTSAAYVGGARNVSFQLQSTSDYTFGHVSIFRPRWTVNTVQFLGISSYASGAPPAFAPMPGIELTVAQRVLRARMSFSSGNINGGSMFLFRRRVIGSPA